MSSSSSSSAYYYSSYPGTGIRNDDVVAPSLTRFYRKLSIPECEQRCLANNHNVTNYKSLRDLMDCFGHFIVEGVGVAKQYCLGRAIEYLEGIAATGCVARTAEAQRDDGPLELFDMYEFMRFLRTYKKKMNSAWYYDHNGQVHANNNTSMTAGGCSNLSSSFRGRRRDADDEQEDNEDDDIDDDLALAMQGIIGSGSGGPPGGVPVPDNGISDDDYEPENAVSSFEYNGRTFYAGKCYNYTYNYENNKKDNGDDDEDENNNPIEVILGILQIDPQKLTAKCVKIQHQSETFLGVSGADGFPEMAKSYGTGFPYVQLMRDIAPLPLSGFGDERKEPELSTIPQLIYKPQEKGEWLNFGYFLDKYSEGRAGGGIRTGIRTKMRVLELYSGAGGCHLGWDSEGFVTAGAVDLDETAMETFRLNNCEYRRSTQRGKTFLVSVKDFVRKWKDDEVFRKELGHIDVIHGSPPCQGFSGANINANGDGSESDKRYRDESLTCIEAVEAIEPDAFVYENVVGIWKKKHLSYINRMLVKLLSIGYQVLVTKTMASQYGCPQKRPRFIMYAFKKKIPVSPHLLLQKPYGDGPDQLPYVTVKDRLEPLLSDEAASRYPNINDVKTTTCKAGEQKVDQLVANQLCPTIRGGSVVLHYSRNRCISVREAAALQGFPNDYEIRGTLSQKYLQIGNAVPFKLASAIARAVKETLLFQYEEGNRDGIEAGGRIQVARFISTPDDIEQDDDDDDVIVISDQQQHIGRQNV